MAHERDEYDQGMDQEWATVRKLPGHTRRDPDGEITHARVRHGQAVLDGYFLQPNGKIERKTKWTEVRGPKPTDGWKPIKRNQRMIDALKP